MVDVDGGFEYKKIKKPANVPWDKYVMMPLNAKKRRIVLDGKFEKLKKFCEGTGLNREEMLETDIGIITSGIATSM